MKKWYGFLILICFYLTGQAESPAGSLWVVYKQTVNGNPVNGGGKTILQAGKNLSVSWRDYTGIKRIPQSPDEKEYISYADSSVFQRAKLRDGSVYHVRIPFPGLPRLVMTNEKDTILGYVCEKVTTSLRSNSIGIWYTKEAGYRGTPQAVYGVPDGLVLKIVRNNNFEIIADSLKIIKNNPEPVLPADMGEKTDQALYRHKITGNYITTVEVFKEEQISWGNKIDNPEEDVTDVTYKYAGGTVILRKMKLPGADPGCQVFAEVIQYSNGDAYDRTGSVFVVPEGKKLTFLDALRKGIDKVPAFTARNGKTYQGMTATGDYWPVVELVRFFTPFGIKHFNDQVAVYGMKWEDSAYYKQEITGLLPLLKGEVWIGAFIGNYDKGGHKLSLNLKYYPGSQEIEEEEKPGKWAIPLFNTLNILEMAGQNYGTLFETDSLTVGFEVPEGIKNAELRYLTTGHGGWDGGDEFNRKENRIFLDNKLIFNFTPWRSDCSTHRLLNPSSGNAWNGMTSSDYSRSGWCPGTATNPVYISLGDLPPGKHVMKVAIPLGKPEGNSFSAWNISGVLTGEK